MIVRELIELLKEQDPEAEVCCLMDDYPLVLPINVVEECKIQPLRMDNKVKRVVGNWCDPEIAELVVLLRK